MGYGPCPAAVQAARRLGAFGPPLPAPPEECRPTGRLHSPTRDAKVISHHYDVGNDFYRLVLGPSMTYSCARFVTERDHPRGGPGGQARADLPQVGPRPAARRARLLDVGCGWGSMAIHAARHHQARSSASPSAASRSTRPSDGWSKAGLADQVEIRLQDYRDLRGEQFDAISSIGMFEHVGAAAMARYFETLAGCWCRPVGC